MASISLRWEVLSRVRELVVESLLLCLVRQQYDATLSLPRKIPQLEAHSGGIGGNTPSHWPWNVSGSPGGSRQCCSEEGSLEHSGEADGWKMDGWMDVMAER